MDYIREIVVKHHKLLNFVSTIERQRMALIGDGIWKGIAASCVAKKDINAQEMAQMMCGLNSNKTMAKFFPAEYIFKYPTVGQHTRATFFEAAIYLEYNKHGFDYVQNKIHAGLIF